MDRDEAREMTRAVKDTLLEVLADMRARALTRMPVLPKRRPRAVYPKRPRGRRTKPPREKRAKGPRGRPAEVCEIDGATYASRQAAAKDLGVRYQDVSNYLSVCRKICRTENGRASARATVRGVAYPSARDAARTLGVSQARVYQARRAGRSDAVGLGKGGRAKAVSIAGQHFASVAEAAETLNMCRETLYGYLRVVRAVQKTAEAGIDTP